jgi:hypothetical protein
MVERLMLRDMARVPFEMKGHHVALPGRIVPWAEEVY